VNLLGWRLGLGRVRVRAAYELGRRSMSHPVGLLNLVRVHHEVLMEILHTARTPEEVQDIVMPQRPSWSMP